jgi:hypothetical protein
MQDLYVITDLCLHVDFTATLTEIQGVKLYERTVNLLGADLEVRTFASLSMICDFEWFCLYFQFVG